MASQRKVKVKHVTLREDMVDFEDRLEHALLCEEAAFAGSVDVPEDPNVLEFMVQHGFVRLQYIDEGDGPMANGVRQMINLGTALKEYPKFLMGKHYLSVDLSGAPLTKILMEEEDAFTAVREFTGASDDDIMYLHGIGIVDQGFGYGRELHEKSLKAPRWLREKALVRFVAATKPNGVGRTPVINKPSLSLNQGAPGTFYIIDIVEPPVYDDTTAYYVCVRPPPGCVRGFNSSSPEKKIRLHKPYVGVTIHGKNPDGSKAAECKRVATFDRLKELFKAGYVGVGFDFENDTMYLREIAGWRQAASAPQALAGQVERFINGSRNL